MLDIMSSSSFPGSWRVSWRGDRRKMRGDQGHPRMSASPVPIVTQEDTHQWCAWCVIPRADHGNSQRYQHRHVTPSPAVIQISHHILGPINFFSLLFALQSNEAKNLIKISSKGNIQEYPHVTVSSDFSSAPDITPQPGPGSHWSGAPGKSWLGSI